MCESKFQKKQEHEIKVPCVLLAVHVCTALLVSGTFFLFFLDCCLLNSVALQIPEDAKEKIIDTIMKILNDEQN